MYQADTERKVPLALIGLGVALYLATAWIYFGIHSLGAAMVYIVLNATLSTILLVVCAFLTAYLLKISFGDFQSAILKLAGASLFVGGVDVILPLSGFLSSILFLILIMWLFELEFTYAWAFGVICWIVRFVIAYVLIMLLARH